ncbi:hypothetical protein RRG08_031971 [Elysia crispata]|uniref:Uncharacterized protein n=1 Tax=Elysia crispata TaxID=231223 RepID=A0AAE1D9E8_9GAST|nr:hypothetical protein RRG08_031971 [Elysia crispata]
MRVTILTRTLTWSDIVKRGQLVLFSDLNNYPHTSSPRDSESQLAVKKFLGQTVCQDIRYYLIHQKGKSSEPTPG